MTVCLLLLPSGWLVEEVEAGWQRTKYQKEQELPATHRCLQGDQCGCMWGVWACAWAWVWVCMVYQCLQCVVYTNSGFILWLEATLVSNI